ncbi:MAG: HEAT repeat domain-containing protein [Nitrospirota bacterium]|nr:MAG: HEAT repeat domain-containing protein [Nitrospirota bacterium]
MTRLSLILPVNLRKICIVGILAILSGGCIIESTPKEQETVVSTLGQLLEDPSADVRRTAALSLGKISHPDGIPPLINALKNEDPQVREYSAWALGQMGPDLSDEAVNELINALGDEVPAVKHAVASALGQVEPDTDRVQLLKEVLAISEVETRKAVIQVLTAFDTPSAYEVILPSLKDPDPRVRQAAVSGLGELADRRAVPLLRKRLLKDPDVGVRTEAAFRLGKLGDTADVSWLEKARKSDSAATVQIWAQWAIEQIEPAAVN